MSNYCVAAVSLKKRGCVSVMLSVCNNARLRAGVCLVHSHALHFSSWVTGCVLKPLVSSLPPLIRWSLCYFHLSSPSKNNFLPLFFLLCLLLPWEQPLYCRAEKDSAVYVHVPCCDIVCGSSGLHQHRSKSLCWLNRSAHSIELMKRSLSSIHWSVRLYFPVWGGHLSFSSRETGVICSSQGKISPKALSFSLCPLPPSASSFSFSLLCLLPISSPFLLFYYSL